MAKRGRALRHRDDLQPDDLLRLADACEIIFHGVLTPASLRREAARGNLELFRIAGKDFVTPAALEAMRERCRRGGARLADGRSGAIPTGKPPKG